MRLLKDTVDEGIIKIDPKVVYLTMELGFSPSDYFSASELSNGTPEYLRMYNGGLGVLAGDIAKSAADLGVPMAFVLPYYPDGFGKQKISETGEQIWLDNPLHAEQHFVSLENVVNENFGAQRLQIDGRLSWLLGENREGPKHALPILMLDYSSSCNPYPFLDSGRLYSGDKMNRLCQEVALGVCGVKAARKLWNAAEKFHLNDSHPAFAVIELLYEQFKKEVPFEKALQNVRNIIRMTTHTPVTDGWDTFSYEMVRNVFGGDFEHNLTQSLHSFNSREISMGYLALFGAGYINAVAKQNAIVAQSFREVGKLTRERENFVRWTDQIPELEKNQWTIDYITNGIYHPGWVSKPMMKVFDKLGNWIDNPDVLDKAPSILLDEEVWNAHKEAKRAYFEYLRKKTGSNLDAEALTIGFARRFASYKRADLLFSDVERLKKIARNWYEKTQKPLQFIMAGVSHPYDENGKELLKKVYNIGYSLNQEPSIRFVFMPDYKISNSKLMVAGVDIWLNTPFKPKEASGTSGMKAAINGVLNLSVDDGWWVEGYRMKPESGWVIGGKPEAYVDESRWQQFYVEDSNSLYNHLDHIPSLFYNNKAEWIKMQKQAIALGAYFNTHRTVKEYCRKAFGLDTINIKEKN